MGVVGTLQFIHRHVTFQLKRYYYKIVIVEYTAKHDFGEHEL